jgi:hypothetical protein
MHINPRRLNPGHLHLRSDVFLLKAIAAAKREIRKSEGPRRGQWIWRLGKYTEILDERRKGRTP